MKRTITITVKLEATRHNMGRVAQLALENVKSDLMPNVTKVPLTTGKGDLAGSVGCATYTWSTKA